MAPPVIKILDKDMFSNKSNRLDHAIICDLVEPNTRVLDIGCGKGDLLKLLTEKKNVDGRGIEIDPIGVENCLTNGLSVMEGDSNNDLYDFPDNSFDFVILSQTLQAISKPHIVLKQMLRLGKYAIISFPNLGHLKCRLYTLFKGKIPSSPYLNERWYDTSSIRLCTLKDFIELAKASNFKINKSIALLGSGKVLPFNNLSTSYSNLFAYNALFLIGRNSE